MHPSGRLFLLLLVAVAALPALAQQNGAALAGHPVSGIVFDPPLQPIPQAEMRSTIGIKEGDVYDELAVRAAIERLYATGRYRQIAVDAEPRDGSVILRFQVEGTFFVGRISVEGVPDPPNQGQLISATKIQLGTEFYPESVNEAVASLTERLRANGFFHPKIDPVLDYDPPTQQVFIHFRVDSGHRAEYTAPEVRGVGQEVRRQVFDASSWRTLFGVLGWKDVTESRTLRGVERIRSTFVKQDFLQSSVNLLEVRHLEVANQAQPVLDISLGPKIRVRTEGAKVSQGRLRQLVPVFQEQSTDRDLLIEGRRNIADYFRARGYFRAEVDYDTRTEPDSTRTILYSVTPGDRYRLVDLRLKGNREFGSGQLRELMATLPANWPRYRRGRFSEQLLDADMAAIRARYQSIGFRDVETTPRVIENWNGKANDLGVEIEIREGERWTVEEFTLEGVSDEHLPYVESRINSTNGQPYSESELAIDRDNVLAYYFNQGYADANLEWTVTPAASPTQVNVSMKVTEGPQYFVRGILVNGLKESDPDMVYERIRLVDGEPLSQSRMVESQRRLYDLGVFARVDMAVQNPDGDEAGKYLVYQFEEARRYSLNVGIGAEIARIGGGAPNFDAPAGEPGFSPRISFGISRSNFYGTGHTLAFQGRASNIQQRAVITYLAPQFKGRQAVTLSFNALFDLSRDIRTFLSRRQEGSVQINQLLSRSDTLQTRFVYRRTTIADLAIDPEQIPIFSRPVRVGVASGTFIRDRRDSPIDSTQGVYYSIDFGYASKIFASETDYLRLLARNSTYHRVPRLGRDFIFARSLSVGWLGNLRPGGAAGIPLPERFFSGGASTHRGFPDNQAGPRDLSTGFPLGGSGLLTNNLELRFPMYGDNVGGVLFHDMGNVYSSLNEVSLKWKQPGRRNFDYMVHAVGLGLRYRTPIGPVRVDFAYVPNSTQFRFGSPSSGEFTDQRISRFQFHFSLGQTF